MGDIADHHVEMYSSGRWGIPIPGANDCPHCGRRGVMRFKECPRDTPLSDPHVCPEGTVENAWRDRPTDYEKKYGKKRK